MIVRRSQVTPCRPACRLRSSMWTWSRMCIQTGHGGAARDRTYVICSHKEKTSCKFDPHIMKDMISSRMKSKGQTRPSDYFMAQTVEVQQEAQLLAEKRNIRYRPLSTDLSYLLNDRERNAVKSYESAYAERFGCPADSDPDLVLFLGDSGDKWRTWSAASGAIPTFRRNSKTGLFWSPYLKRFLVAREKLACLAWPVTPAMSRSMCCGVIPGQDILRCSALLGNAMHFCTVGVAQLIALSCFGPMD